MNTTGFGMGVCHGLSGLQACMGRCPDTRGGRGGVPPSNFFRYDKEGPVEEGGRGLPPPSEGPRPPSPPTTLSFPYKPGCTQSGAVAWSSGTS